MEEKTLHLSEKESRILRDVCFAGMEVLHAGDPEKPAEVPLSDVLNEFMARQAVRVFNFFRCAWSGNEEGVKRQAVAQKNQGSRAGSGYYDGMIQDYHQIMEQMMGSDYTSEDVTILHKRLKGFLKEQNSPAPRILYIADCHFYHRRLNTEMDRRGFASVEEMNGHMIRQWNTAVNRKDDVYILGDFSLVDGFQTAGILERLNGRKHLIIGNHDERHLRDKHFDDRLYRSVKQYEEIRDKGRTVILSHYPVFCYKGQYRRDKQGNPMTYMLYGHVHNTHDEALINRFIEETRATRVQFRHMPELEPVPCQMINCFCMFSDYRPLTLDDWIMVDRKRRERMCTEE